MMATFDDVTKNKHLAWHKFYIETFNNNKFNNLKKPFIHTKVIIHKATKIN
jgi:hypothetical protein